MLRAAIAALAGAVFMAAADPPQAPIAGNPVVNISGRIARVDAFRPGAGMPTLVVESEGTQTTVVLGSMRYLMEQNFNPKAGAQIEVKGYKQATSVIAIEVRLPAEDLTLKLRDKDGRPLWRGGGCPHCGQPKK